MIGYTPIGFTVPKDRHDQTKDKEINRNKNRICKIACAQDDKYFVMSDLDMFYEGGLKSAVAYMDEHEDYGAVALFPHDREEQEREGLHISSQFILIRTAAVKDFQAPIEGACWCHRLCEYLRSTGWKVRYMGRKVKHGKFYNEN